MTKYSSLLKRRRSKFCEVIRSNAHWRSFAGFGIRRIWEVFQAVGRRAKQKLALKGYVKKIMTIKRRYLRTQGGIQNGFELCLASEELILMG